MAETKNIITVKNAEGDPDTTAEIVIQNKIDFEPKVSVIIPVYNVEKYLRECLDSVVNQTLKEIEIICVDDGSTDSSLEILKEYASKDNRITVMRQENLHAGVARNAGLTVAKGEYLSFLDSDDFFELNMLEEAYKKAIKNQSDILIFNWIMVDEINKTKKNSTEGVPFWVSEKLKYNDAYNFSQEIKSNLFFTTNPAPWNKLYKKDFILKYGIKFQNLTCCNDIGFNTSALALSQNINVLNKTLAYYRKRPNNTSTTKEESKSDNILKAGLYIKNNLKKFKIFDKFEEGFYRGISLSFYWEYCRTKDIKKQTEKYKNFLPAKYYEEFKSKFDGPRKRKIFLIGSNNVCDTIGGANTVFWERASLFAKIGFDVSCIFSNKKKTEESFNADNQLKIINIHTFNNQNLSVCAKFNILLTKEQPDLLIFFFPTKIHEYTKDLDISKFKTLLMLHSRPDFYFEKDNNPQEISTICQKIQYAQVLMPSFVNILKKYTSNQLIEVIPNYVNNPEKITKNKNYNKFIFYSRCDGGKNISLLINAFKIVHDKHPNWTLEIYGQSEPETYMLIIENLIDLYGLSNCVKYTPKSKTGTEVLNEADICVFPSYFEGQSLGLCEALSFGLPAIVLNKCSGSNEIVKDGYNGLHADDNPFDFAEKMLTLVENPELRKKMSQNAIESMEKYTKSNIDNQWIKFVSQIINNSFIEQNFNMIANKHIYDISYIKEKWDEINPHLEFLKISVIIPVYNVEEYLRKCLDSVVNQTYKNLEIICINDGSTDNSLDILKEYAEKDNRIVIINQENKGLANARNKGLQKSTGDYFTFVDSDDWLDLNYIEIMLKNIIKSNGDIAKSGYLHVFQDGHIVPDSINTTIDKKNGTNLNPTENNIIACATLYKKNFMTKNNILYFDSDINKHEDILYTLKTCFTAQKIIPVTNTYYNYRRTSSILSRFSYSMSEIIPIINDRSITFLNSIHINKEDYIKAVQRIIWRTFDTYKKLSTIKEFEKDKFKFLFNTFKTFKKIKYKNSSFSAYINMLQKLNKKYINKLLNTNSLLMVELNNCHGECMPGYIKYFKDLGFDIDVIINEKQKTENPLYMFDDIDITYLPEYKIIQYLNSNQIDNYEICLFNSNIIYNQKSKSVFNLIKIPHPKTKMLCVEHRLENIKKLSKNAIPIILKKFSENKKAFEVNPHYFGKIKHHNKNKTTNFIVVGNIEGKRKNYNLLTSSVQKLHKNNIKNFKITIVGAGKVSDIPPEIRHYFDIKGRLSYPDMYQEVQNSDYFLTLLDPENPEHDRYIKIGTSGSFQLIYGFNIPCLIEEKFAKIHCFDSANALTYKNNSDLFETMKLAINQSNDEYQNMKGHLSKTSDLIYQNSLKNLGLALNTKQPNQISNCYKKLLKLYVKPYLLFPVYLIKTAKMKKKIHKKVCRIIRGQLSRQFENTLLLTKQQIRDFALKNSPTPDYTKKHIKKITNDIYDKFHFRKKHRILGIKFYTKNKHKELSSLLTYSIKQNDLLKQENSVFKNQIEETKKENSVLKSQIEELNNNQIELQKNFSDLSEKSLKITNLPQITDLTIIKNKYLFDSIKFPNMKNNWETIEELINTEKSIIRMGDGEYNIIEGGKAVFQKENSFIAEKLKEILLIDDDNLLVGIPEPYYTYPTTLSETSKRFISNWLPKWHEIIMKYNNPNKTYYSTFISQTFPVFASYNFEEHYSKLKKIWDNKDITIITGDRVFNKIDYNIFENAKSIEYIYGPTVDAFNEYDSLKEKISKTYKNRILIFALGPCGKILAYDMYKQGYRVLDLGHLIKDYDFYKKSISMTKQEFSNARKTFFGKD